jgi:hypothetical protein
MTMRLNEKIEDNKGVIRRRKSKMNIQYNGQKKKRTNEQTTIYKTLHWKQKIEQHEPQWKQGWTQLLLREG